MKDRGNPLTIPAHSLCEGYSIDGVPIKSVRLRGQHLWHDTALSCPSVIVQLANGKTLNFNLHDEVEVDR